MAYSVFDDPKLYKKPDTRNWDSKTGNGWRRNKGGDWQYYANFKAVEGKVDKSGVKDVANLGKEGWNILPTKEVEPIPQRPHNWFDSAPKTDAYASQPGTGQFIRLPEDMQTTTAEDRGNLATAKAVQNTDIANQRSIGANKARASWLKATSNSPAAKAGFSDDERWNLQQQHRKWKADRSPQVERQADATKGAQFKSNITGKTYNIPELETSPWDNKTGAPLIKSKGQMPLNIAELPKGTVLGGLNVNYDTPPKGWDGGAAFKQDSAAGLSGADMAGMLGKALQMIDKKNQNKESGPIANVNTSNKGIIDYDPFAMYTL